MKFAALWGDRNKGAYGALAKFAGGAEHPLHTHSREIKGIVLAGTWWSAGENGEKKKLGAGSYMLIPGGWKHSSGCAAGADCVIFQEQAGKFDMKPVAAAGEKPAKKPGEKPAAKPAEKAPAK